MKTLPRSTKFNATASFGPLVARYQPPRFSAGVRSVFAFLVSSGVLITLGFAAWFHQQIAAQNGQLAAIQRSLPWVFLACLILLGYLGLVLQKNALSTNCIDLYQNGLEIYRFLRRPVWIPLKDIQGVIENPITEKFLFIKLRSIYHLEVLTYSGKKIKFHTQIVNLPELAARIKASIYPTQKKQIEAHLQAGEAVGFGALIFTDGCLYWKRQLIPWNAITNLEVIAGILSIQQRTAPRPFHKSPTFRIPISKIPNYDLFVQLARERIVT